MSRADFRIVLFFEHLGNREGDLETDFPFVGNQTSIKTFDVGGTPAGEGYVLLQTYDVDTYRHSLIINGLETGYVHLLAQVGAAHWHTAMFTFPKELLHTGENTMQILRASGGDNFLVGPAAVHWREED